MSYEDQQATRAPDSGQGRRILFLTPQPPSPTRQGAAIRNWNIMVQLAASHRLDLLTFGNPDESLTVRRLSGRADVPWEQAIVVPPPRRSLLRRLRVLLFSLQPDMADRHWSSAFARELSALIQRERYDIVQGEGIELARYLRLFVRYIPLEYRPLLVFDDHNVEWLLQRRAAKTDLRRKGKWLNGLYSALQWHRLRRFEAQTMQGCDLTIAVSESDAAALRHLAPARPLIIAPNGVDTSYYTPEGVPRERPRFDLVFSGTLDYRPNIDAVLWFVRDVWPLLKQDRDPRRDRPLRLALVGRNPTAEITRLVLQPGVTVTGSVADDRPYFAGATVYILPMRYGGGVRLKLLNALAMGAPVVSTTAGAEGIDVVDGEHLLLADDAPAFAAAIGRLLDDPALRERLSVAGRAFTRAHYDWRGIVARIEAGYDLALAARQSQLAAATTTPTSEPSTSEPPPLNRVESP